MQSKWPLWTFYAQIILGFWLLFSPYTFPTHNSPLHFSDLTCGIFLILFGWWGRQNPRWNIPLLAIGIWLQAAPLLLWAPTPAIYFNDTLIGLLVITFSFLLVPTPGQLPDTGPEIPPGWTYNPSSWPQRLPIALFALLCWFISRYLAAYQLGYIDAIWDPFFGSGSEQVLNSDVSKAFPVSDAGLGAFAYTFEFLSALQGGTRRWRISPWMVILFGILVIPVSLTSAILIILQPLVVGHWCFWCLFTAALMLIGIPFAIDEVALTLQYLKRSKKPWTLFFKGGDCRKTTEDRRTPSLDSSLYNLWEASLWGMTMPWNLLLSIPVGIAFMVVPKMLGMQGWILDLNLILGAFAVMVAVISFAEKARAFRWVNAGFATLLVLGACAEQAQLNFQIASFQGITALLLLLLSIPKGSIREGAELKF